MKHKLLYSTMYCTIQCTVHCTIQCYYTVQRTVQYTVHSTLGEMTSAVMTVMTQEPGNQLQRIILSCIH